VIYGTLFQFPLEFLAAIIEASGDDMTALQHAARPRITGMPVRAGKLALWMIEILIEDLSVTLDRDPAVLGRTDCDAAFFAGGADYCSPTG
jgi:hypothetical protein